MPDSPMSDLHLEVLASGPQRRISERHRFLLLTAGSIGMICSSFGYAFSLVMPRMQERYNFTQRETASVTCVGLVFGYFMLPFGFLFDYLGPTPVAILSIIAYPLGGLLTALCFEGVIQGTAVRLCVFNAIQGIGMSLSDLVCCMTVISHFPSNRGPVIALLKTCIGLGSAIVGSLYTGFFNKHISHYLFFLAALSFVMNIVLASLMRLPSYQLTGYEESHLSAEEKQRRTARKAQYLRQRPPMWRFVYGLVILLILIGYLPTTSALIAYQSLNRTCKLGFGIGTAVLTCSYLLMAVPMPTAITRRVSWCRRENESDSEDDDVEQHQQQQQRLNVGAELTAVEAHSIRAHIVAEDRPHSSTSENEPYQPEKAVAGLEELDSNGRSPHPMVETDVDFLAPQYQGTFWQNLKTLELWALWWTLFTVIGAEFVIIYNASFILGALQGSKPSDSLTTLLTVLNGVGSAAGRLLMAGFEMWSQKRRAEDRIPITLALFFPTTTVIIALVLFLTLPAKALPLPYVVAAFGNGFCAATQILVTRTIFAKDAAKHYHFCFSSTMMATIVFNRMLYAEWYTVQAEKQHNNLCYGKSCVLMPLVVLLGLACSAFATDVVVHFRYRAYSHKVLAERARLRGEFTGKMLDDDVEGELDDGLEGGAVHPVRAIRNA